MQFGGPDSLRAVRPFLRNLFMDPYIVDFPGGILVRIPFAEIVSRLRTLSIKDKYGLIGGRSPINEETKKQERALERLLNSTSSSDTRFRVVTAMRYWKPSTREAIETLDRENINDVVLLPLYPQYCRTNAGSSFAEWEKQLKKVGTTFTEKRIRSYETDPLYIKAMNARINEALDKFSDEEKKNLTLLFSAHGIPVLIADEGDPYPQHIARTVEAIMTMRGRDFPCELCYQSKVGPRKWLEPATNDTIRRLAKNGAENLLVVPVAFVSDHIESAYELDIESREVADEAGINKFIVMEGLNDHPAFIETLAALVHSALT